jgi:hypothetical protein
MVGVALNGVDVRHLDYGEQRQQDQTHYGDNRPGTRPGVESCAQISSKSCQRTTLYLKDTHSWMRWNRSGLRA